MDHAHHHPMLPEETGIGMIVDDRDEVLHLVVLVKLQLFLMLGIVLCWLVLKLCGVHQGDLRHPRRVQVARESRGEVSWKRHHLVESKMMVGCQTARSKRHQISRQDLLKDHCRYFLCCRGTRTAEP